MKKAHNEKSNLDIYEIDEYAEMASNGSAEFERLLSDFMPFLKSHVSRSVKKSGSKDLFDEMMSDAILAFYEAVKSYDRGKGHFFPFMRRIVSNRIIDFLRKTKSGRLPTVPLESDDAENQGQASQIYAASVKIHHENERRGELVIEIESYKRELAEWGISMNALEAHSPKHTRLRGICREIIEAAAADFEIMQIMRTKRYFPIKKVSDLTEIPQKTIERIRMFLIGSLIIRDGDYYHLKEYVTARSA